VNGNTKGVMVMKLGRSSEKGDVHHEGIDMSEKGGKEQVGEMKEGNQQGGGEGGIGSKIPTLAGGSYTGPVR